MHKTECFWNFQELTRRGLFKAGGAMILGGQVCALASLEEDALDEAYSRIAAGFPDTNLHWSNHAPMVCEALVELGRSASISSWLDANLDPRDPATLSGQCIERESWQTALGRSDRVADWAELFRRMLAESSWRAVLAEWLPRLAPGLAAAATHGAIRVAHIARALERRESAVRKSELALALAYWAATYVTLPWDGSIAPKSSLEQAISSVPLRASASPAPRGSIVEGLATLDTRPEFAIVAGWIEVGDPLAQLSALTASFAKLYVAQPEGRIAHAHAITATSAVRLLAPHLCTEALASAVRYAWQAAAAIRAVYTASDASQAGFGDGKEPVPLDAADAITRAIERGGAHNIKLLEVCLREWNASGAGHFSAAAWDAATCGRF